MLDTYEETQSRGAYQVPTQPAMPITAPHQAVPGYLQTPPTIPGVRMGCAQVLLWLCHWCFCSSWVLAYLPDGNSAEPAP